MFSNVFLKSFRILLFPFALLYGIVVFIRNWLYDVGVTKSAQFGLPVICVGNLSVGGTGKSPMVEYLMDMLHNKKKIATLSRGYKRKTKGYALAGPTTTAIDIGDEPMLFHKKFPDVPVAVGEERLVAIPQLLHDRPDTEVIILDDAFQHRRIQAGFNILLTDFNNLYTRDFFLPTGDLRDSRLSSSRAQVIIVTKCPQGLTTEESKELRRELKPANNQAVFFTSIFYGSPYHLFGHNAISLTVQTEVLLVTGIANPTPLKHFLEETVYTYYMMHYQDHHIFTIDDLKEIEARFAKIEAAHKIILTTEKDAMRLLKFGPQLQHLPVYAIPIQHRFLLEGAQQFEHLVINFIQNFKQPAQDGPEK